MSKTKGDVASFLLTGALFLTYIASLHPWFFWGVGNWIILFGLLVIMGCFVLFPNFFSRVNVRGEVLLLLLFALVFQYRTVNFFGIVFLVISFLFIGFVLALRNDVKVLLLQRLTKWLACFLFVSLLFWILHQLGIKQPSAFVEYVQDGNTLYTYTNYYWFMIDNRSVDSLLPRFSSVFLEPGHLGMATSLLLAANGFNIKNKYSFIILVVTLCTFSLAAYVILFLGKLFQLFVERYKYRMVVLFTFILLIIGSWFFAAIHNNGDNILNNYIFSRFELTGDEDIIAGNNRFSADFEYYFEMFMRSSDKWLGIGSEYDGTSWDGGNAGYKVFIVQYGLIGTFFVLLFYFALLRGRFSWGGLALVGLFLISYLQRGYPFWMCFLITVILGVQCKYNDKQIRIDS